MPFSRGKYIKTSKTRIMPSIFERESWYLKILILKNP